MQQFHHEFQQIVYTKSDLLFVIVMMRHAVGPGFVCISLMSRTSLCVIYALTLR